MSGFNSLEEARRYFSGDKFATENGMVLEELDANHSKCTLKLTERHRNALGGVMGGAIFTLADLAFASLTNDRERMAVAQQVSINFLNAAKGDTLIAVATYRKDGRNSNVVNVNVTDNTGLDIAQFVGVGFKLRK